MDRHPTANSQILDAVIRPRSARTLQPFDRLAVKPLDLAEAQPQRSILQRAVPVAMVHVDAKHLDAMLLRIADDLGRPLDAHVEGVVGTAHHLLRTCERDELPQHLDVVHDRVEEEAPQRR